ncbi:MAG: hypothetical protein WDA16_02680 [Candidatus Thermoplasmatota archaeon]
MATAKRKAPPTHPTVWIGLGLAAVGLLVAMFAYSGTRVYDITYAIIAVVGAVVALAGILLAAWGRAVMSARAQRSRRAFTHEDSLTLTEGVGAPPTVAEPPSKKRFAFKKVDKAPLERLQLECPECNTRFQAEGRRPFVAKCPACDHQEPV